jgi:hypothetical protein
MVSHWSFRRHVIACTLVACGASLLLASPVTAKKKLDEGTASSGLKEALSVGTGRAVDALGAVDGYLKNDAVRIEAPSALKPVEKALKLMGQEQLVDEFVTSMNRAAEAAAPLAKQVFLDTIKEMTFQDALTIVRGKEHEATDYLEAHSRDRLTELFRPIVSTKLQEVGATAAFDKLVDRYATVPFAGKPVVDLDGHVTHAALDGLFTMVGKEEENIRTNVVARTTDLLQQVFGEGAGKTKSNWLDKLPK